jgi:hypothetical protein
LNEKRRTLAATVEGVQGTTILRILHSRTFSHSLGQKLTSRECPLLADCVEKLENRGAPKISQM